MEKQAERIWGSARALFHHGRIEDTLRKELPNSDLRLALMVVLVSGILLSLLSIATNIERIYMINYAIDVASEAAVEAPPPMAFGDIAPYAIFQLLFNVPFFILFAFIYEGIVFALMKITGGEGAFAQQFYLSSLVTLAWGIASGLSLLLVFPCIDMLAALALTVLTLYFLLIVNVKAYGMVHRISFLHGLVVVVALLVPRFWVLITVPAIVAGLLGLPQPFGLSGVEYGI
jgi:hypothetical protein